MGLLLGIDVGGSRTRALLATVGGEAVGYGEAGAGNHETVGYEGLRAAMGAAMERAAAMARRRGMAEGELEPAALSAAGLGVAGFDWESEREETMAAIRALGLRCPVELRNDSALGLFAGSRDGWGLNLVAGTSNNCYGLSRDGREGRIAGHSATVGENGGGAEIAQQALIAVNHARIRRAPPTMLTEILCSLAGARDADDLIEGVTMERWSADASWAPEVFRAARSGDQAAKGIIEWAGRELAESAAAVVRQLGLEEQRFELVLSGSLFDLSPRLEESLTPLLHATAPFALPVHLGAPPVIGAAVLAARALGIETAPVRLRLLDSTPGMLG